LRSTLGTAQFLANKKTLASSRALHADAGGNHFIYRKAIYKPPIGCHIITKGAIAHKG